MPDRAAATVAEKQQNDRNIQRIISHDSANGEVNEQIKPSSKAVSSISNLRIPAYYPERSQSPDTRSIVSADDFSELRQTTSFSDDPTPLQDAFTGETSATWRGKINRSWIKNKGVALVLFSQIFGTLMNVTTRLLENDHGDDKGMHPFQILFARMSITSALCMLWMWWTHVPDFPLGARGIRLLLVARGTGGFFGVFGLYWSLQYLPLADATVLTFLAPIIASWACSKLLHEPFTRTEQLCGLISLIGVVLIARPTSFFSSSSSSAPESSSPDIDRRTDSPSLPEPTPKQHLAAVGMAMVGVLGASVAYTTIRWIGKRAHPLLSVNYFASWCTIVSTIALAFIPSIPFVLPHSLRQWGLLIFIGINGFVMQFLLTAGLRYEKSSRATNMSYSQMLFALLFDRLIWGKTPSVMSIIGSSLILGGAIVVAVQKSRVEGLEPEGAKVRDGRVRAVARDEEVALMDEIVDEEGLEMETHVQRPSLTERTIDDGQRRSIDEDRGQ